MSRIDYELASCVGKQRFLTYAEARKIVKRMKQRGKGGANVFKCRFCHHWHIGRSNRDD